MTRQETIISGASSLDALLHRMHGDSDFPALSGVISEINRLASSDSGSHGQLAKAVLQDVAVSYKLLRLVGTARYRPFGQNINTVSKAITILGFEVVRDIATTIFLLNFLQNKSQASYIKDEIIFALLAGLISAKLPSPEYHGNKEEMVVCSMFSHIGKLLATYYFFEESQSIARLLKDSKMTDDQAEIKVLGLSYSELGIGVVKGWNFSPSIIAGMRRLPKGNIGNPHTGADYLCATVNLANDLCNIIATTPYEENDHSLQQLCERYRNAIKVTKEDLLNALDNAIQDLMGRSEILEINISESTLIKNAMVWLTQNIETNI
jgi:HD-like signal output (HDOD) protein